jgi:hypothetical protein
VVRERAAQLLHQSERTPLAVADINIAGCGGVSLTIDGMAEPRLEGGWSLVEEISQALGIRPAPEKPKPHHRHYRTHL